MARDEVFNCQSKCSLRDLDSVNMVGGNVCKLDRTRQIGEGCRRETIATSGHWGCILEIDAMALGEICDALSYAPGCRKPKACHSYFQ